MKSVFKYLLCGAALTLHACADPGPHTPQRMAIEGMIDSDGYPSVLVTMSAMPGEEPVDVSEIVVRHASLSVTDLTDGITTMLTAKVDSRYFPPFRYFSSEIQGRPGHIYRLCARYRGQEAVAECAMPPAPRIDSVTQAPVAGNDTLRSLTLHLTAPPDCPAWYHVSTRVAGLETRYLPGVLGTAEATEPGAQVAIPVMRGKTSTARDDHALQMPAGSTVDIRLERVTRAVYDFWRAFDNATIIGDSQFIGLHESLPGNVDGGYGVWSACGSTYIRVAVE